MENREKILLTVALTVQELIDSSSSESDDELLKYLERNINSNPRRRVQRIDNYVEEIVPLLTKEEFKAHFRYYLLMLMIFLFKRKKIIY
jgi:hypothetical protein